MSERISPDKDKRREREIKEHFEVLGRFVQAFELMVDAARSGCVLLTSVDPKHQRLINVAFHHHSITAQPLFDIWRGIIAEIRKPDKSEMISGEIAEDKPIMDAIIKQIAKDYQELVRARNRILHGTWHIGWAHPDDEDFSKLMLSKFEVTQTGLTRANTLENLQGMHCYVARFASTEHLIRRATNVVLLGRRFKPNFLFRQRVWYSPDDPLVPRDEALRETQSQGQSAR